MKNTITIAGIKIYNQTLSSLLSEINLQDTHNQQLKAILTANPEIIVQAQDDPKLKEILNSAWLAIPDGVGISLAAKFQKRKISERITGIELTKQLLKIAQKRNLTVGIIGGTKKASSEYEKYLTSNFELRTSWSLPGPWIDTKSYDHFTHKATHWIETNEGIEFLRKIKDTSILFVTMGAPKQEFFIDFLTRSSYFEHRLSLLLVAVGGTFDELSGIVPKPPTWVENFGLKWLFRLITEPWRIKRQLRLIRFIMLSFSKN
jgi:N-acetylglucosaminyldiphosphoundecaprenol N-acetyl-beta-D-mannosaminyltransferase